MADLPLTVLSQTATTIKLGWTPPADARGFIFYADGKQLSHTMDRTRSQVVFRKGPKEYRVEAMGVTASGVWPAVQPDPPPTGGTNVTPQTLSTAYGKAKPGDLLILADGTYSAFTFTRPGVTLLGSRAAVLKGTVETRADDLVFKGLSIVGSGNVTTQVFGNRNKFLNVDITNNHQGETGLIIGEYEGSYAKLIAGTVVDGCRIHDCGKASNGDHDHGIYVASSVDAQITNNVIFGSAAAGVQLWADAHRTQVLHNTIDSSGWHGVEIGGQAGGPSGLGPSANNTVRDNIISYCDYYVHSYNVGKGNTVDGNVFYGGNGVGNEGGLIVGSNVTADPQYVDRANHNYALKAGSPATGKGPQ